MTYTFANPDTGEESPSNFRTFPLDPRDNYIFPPDSEMPSVESLLHPFETSDIRNVPHPSEQRQLKEPPKEPADLGQFDREVQAGIRRYYAKRKNRPELERGRSEESLPYDDYPIPVYDDMRIDPKKNEYFRSISAWYTTETPEQYWGGRKDDLRHKEAARLMDQEKKMREEEVHVLANVQS